MCWYPLLSTYLSLKPIHHRLRFMAILTTLTWTFSRLSPQCRKSFHPRWTVPPLHNLLNNLAPLKTRSVTFTCSSPWFTPSLSVLKAKGRQFEHLYRKNGLTAHKEMFYNHISRYKDCIMQAKSIYYSGLINSNEGDKRALFSLLRNITQPPDSLPAHMYSAAFYNSLISFFSVLFLFFLPLLHWCSLIRHCQYSLYLLQLKFLT